MFRAFLVAAAAAAAVAVGGASPASGDEYTTDELFYLWNVANGIDIGPEDASLQGNSVCVVLASGTDFYSTVIQLSAMHPKWSTDDAARFVGAATSAYCPEGDYIPD